MLPKLLLWVKPPEMGCHDRECSRPDIVDQGDRSMAVATRDEQPTPGHACYRRAATPAPAYGDVRARPANACSVQETGRP